MLAHLCAQAVDQVVEPPLAAVKGVQAAVSALRCCNTKRSTRHTSCPGPRLRRLVGRASLASLTRKRVIGNKATALVFSSFCATLTADANGMGETVQLADTY